MPETKLKRADLTELVVLIIVNVTGADPNWVFPDTKILSIQNTDRSDLAEICFQIEQKFRIRDIVEREGYHNMSRAELQEVTAAQFVDFVCRELGV